MHEKYLNAIKSFEGYTPRAKWDYAQNSNGYGTKALYAGESIDRGEADRRFMAEIEQARSFVERHAKRWDEGTKAALTSLTFNAGTRWTSGALGDAVRAFDVEAVEKKFVTYAKAGGQVLPGLVKRRLVEVAWIGQSTSPPPTPPIDSGAMSTVVTVAASQTADARSPQVAVTEAKVLSDAERDRQRAVIDRPSEGAQLSSAFQTPPRSLAAAAHALLVLDARVLPRDDLSTLASRRTRRGRAHV